MEPADLVNNRPGDAQSDSSTAIFYAHNLGSSAPVAIDVSADDGQTWTPVEETVTRGSTTSSFRWTVDLAPTPRARARSGRERERAEGTASAFEVTGAPSSPWREDAHESRAARGG